jgi:hypothetical protein
VRTVTPSSSAARAGAVSSRAAHIIVRDIVSLIMVYVFSVCSAMIFWDKKANPAASVGDTSCIGRPAAAGGWVGGDPHDSASHSDQASLTHTPPSKSNIFTSICYKKLVSK